MAFGALLGQTASGGGGKRVCRFTVGTSTAGWTANDCDYLCDGTNDQVEINSAIQALPTDGGEVVILDGTYNITATIAINKNNIKLSGNGAATILQRGFNGSTSAIEGVIAITAASNGGCCVENLQVDGNRSIYESDYNCGIYVNSDNNIITGNICNNNANYYGIYLYGNNNTVTGNTCSSNFDGIGPSGYNNTITGNTCYNNNGVGIYNSGRNNTITGNTCYNNNDAGIYNSGKNNTFTGNTCYSNHTHGIYIDSNNNTVTGNICNDNRICGIYLDEGENNTITGNTCIRGDGASSDYTSSQYTIQADDYSSRNLFVGNNIKGKNYVDSGTNNTWANNKYN